jgi:hypothetical protein
MAVKVIKRNPKRITCKYCDTILEYLPKDVKLKDFGDGDYGHFIKCPECKEDVYTNKD